MAAVPTQPLSSRPSFAPIAGNAKPPVRPSRFSNPTETIPAPAMALRRIVPATATPIDLRRAPHG
jgi:hypothetical protein